MVLAGCTSSPPPEAPPAPRPSATATPTPTREELMREYAPGLQAEVKNFSLADEATGGPPLTVTLDAGADPVGQWHTTNTGLSFETSDLVDERWEPGESSLDLLIGELNEPAIRFGGNSVDRRVWWTSTGEPAPDWAEVTVTPEDLKRFARFADEVDATVTMVLPLGHFDAHRAADMAEHAHAALGDRLMSVAYGNEPNGYHHPNQPELELRGADWGPEDWVQQAEAYHRTVSAAVPDLQVMGPGAYDASWWRAFGKSDLSNKRALSQHWYPLWSCPDRTAPGGDKRFAPTVANMTSEHVHDKAASTVTWGRETADEYDLRLYLDETGPTSCPGTNETSRTLAQGLWSVDYVFNGAAHGALRVNMHSTLDACDGGAPMSVICSRGDLEDPSDEVLGQSNYLGLLFAGQVRSGEFEPIEVEGNKQVFAYQVHSEEGTDVVIVNMQNPEKVKASALEVKGLPDGEVSAALLAGDALDERETEMIPLSPASQVPDRIPAGGALLIRIEPRATTPSPGQSSPGQSSPGQPSPGESSPGQSLGSSPSASSSATGSPSGSASASASSSATGD